jgi:hypothetical protein
VAVPPTSASDEVCVVPSTAIVNVPVGVAVLEADPEATVIVIASLAPDAGVVVAAETVVFEATGTAAATVTMTEPLEDAYVASPE